MKNFNISEIDEKVLRGEELTSKEVQLIFWDYDSIAEENGEHHRWWYPVYKVFQVGERYFQVWGMIGLTENQESEYEPQVAVEVEQREKVILKWEAVEWHMIGELGSGTDILAEDDSPKNMEDENAER